MLGGGRAVVLLPCLLPAVVLACRVVGVNGWRQSVGILGGGGESVK